MSKNKELEEIMAMNDRVTVKPVGSGMIFNSSNTTDMVLIYEPVLDEHKNYVFDSAKSVIVKRIGGVKAGSTGTIVGPSLSVSRKSFVIEYGPEVNSSTDLIQLFPIQFDQYAGIGFVPADAVRYY